MSYHCDICDNIIVGEALHSRWNPSLSQLGRIPITDICIECAIAVQEFVEKRKEMFTK